MLYFLILTGDFCSAKHTALMMVDSVWMSQFTYVEPKIHPHPKIQRDLQSWSKVLGTPSVNLWRNFLSVVTNTRLRYFSRIPWRHAPRLPPYNVEWISGQRFTKYNIEMGGRGVILTLTIGDVKIVTLVGQCPNNFVQDCRYRRLYIARPKDWALVNAKARQD